MENIKDIVARNIVALRKKNGLTQIALSEQINYSDKAISRWESGEVTPDVETLNKLAQIFNVKVASFFEENLDIEKQEIPAPRKRKSKLIISLLSICLVWILATLAYVLLLITTKYNIWQIFVYATTVSLIVSVVFAGIWGNKFLRYFSVSALMWSTLISFYILFLPFNIWPLFIFGIPMQAAIIMWTRLIRINKANTSDKKNIKK